MATRPAKIPLWATLDRAFEITFDNWRPALRIAGAWAIVAFVLVAMIHWLLAGWRTDGLLDPPGLLSLLVSLVAGCSIAVGWHRLFLLDEKPSARYLRLDAVVASYAGIVVAMFLVPVVPMHILDWLGAPMEVNLARNGVQTWWAMALLVYIAITFVAIVRAAVRLAGLAIGNPPAPGEVYRRTKGNSFRLLFGATIASVPLGVALSLVEMWGPGRSTPVRFALTEAMSESANLIFSVVIVAFLSLAYRQLFGERD